MPQKTIADAGLLVAYLDEDEAHHEWAVQMFRRNECFYTCEAVLAEACARLTCLGIAPWRVIRLINDEVLLLDFNLETKAHRVEQLMTKYRDQPMDFADACLVVMTEQFADSLVVTLDAKDFSVYRRHERQVVPFLAPRK
jgi:predicted nucleic acid-binding protein